MEDRGEMTCNKQTSETSKTPVEQATVTLTLKRWEAWRRAAGLHIDPETAEVFWAYGYVLDPYGDWPDIPEECQCLGRNYFARSPGMSVWIEFGDLPEATRDALWEKHKGSLAFPAGLEVSPAEWEEARKAAELERLEGDGLPTEPESGAA